MCLCNLGQGLVGPPVDVMSQDSSSHLTHLASNTPTLAYQMSRREIGQLRARPDRTVSLLSCPGMAWILRSPASSSTEGFR